MSLSPKDFIAPVSIQNHRLSDVFNPKRMHPKKKIILPHRGIDIAHVVSGTKSDILATQSGTVHLKASGIAGYGNVLVIYHGSTADKHIYTLYAHLDSFSPGLVSGSSVTQG